MSPDVYKRHQQVWQAVAPFAEQGQDFLFQRVDAGIFRVRSRKLGRHGAPVAVPNGVCVLRGHLSRAVIRQGRQVTVRDDEVGGWFRTVARNHGLMVRAAAFGSGPKEAGVKVGADGTAHEIRFETVEVEACVEQLEEFAFERVLESGLGRGRRFGYGMMDLRAL